MMQFGTPCAVITSRPEALLSIQTSYISPFSTISTTHLGYSAGTGGKNHWPEADEELTCVMGACNIVLHKTDPTVCVFTAPMRRDGGAHSGAISRTGFYSTGVTQQIVP